MKLIISLFFFFVLTLNSLGQGSLGLWNAYNTNIRFSRPAIRFHTDIQYRDYQFIGDLNQIIFRPGIQYHHVKSNSTYTLGYAFFLFGEKGDSKNTIIENRFYQDIDLRQSIQRIGLRHRFRFEERYIQSEFFRFRIRYALFLNIPLNNPTVQSKTWYIPLFSEVFLNPDPSIAGNVFDRNWLHGGLGYQATDRFGIQLGWMMESTRKIPTHQLWLTINHVINLKKGQ